MDVNDDLKLLVELLKNEREEQNFTKTDLAEKAFGARASYITQLESDKDFKKLTYENFYQLCKVFDVQPRDFLRKIQRKKTKGYLFIKGKSIKEDTSTELSPAHVIRQGDVISEKEVSYYSLLDASGKEQEIITEFQMVLSTWHGRSESKQHFQWGEEFFLLLEGNLSYNFIDKESKGTLTSEKWTHCESLVGLDKSKNEDNNFMWLKAWYPHQGKTGNEGATALIINLDPRGDSGLFDFDEIGNKSSKQKSKQDSFTIQENAKLNVPVLLRGLGVKLKKARLRSGLSATELAEDINTSPVDLYKIENSLVNPKISTILLMAKYLDIDFMTLFPDIKPPIQKGNLNKIKSDINKNIKYDSISLKKIITKKINNLSANLKIFKVSPIFNDKEVRFESEKYDIAFFVLDGFFDFGFKGDKYEDNAITQHTLKAWDTIYVQKNNDHYFRPSKDSINSSALLIYTRKYAED